MNSKFRKTHSRVAICPFFSWTSEDSKEASENDVNLIFCNHPDNIDKHEGNCRADICPLLKN